jgi:pimeloyl-ACP methyl ester carboxylesterase
MGTAARAVSGHDRGMRKAELRAGTQGREIAATLFLPDGPLPAHPIVMFASPGGGYARGYFDLRFGGLDGYSQAEHHTRAGLVLVAYDHLGVGDSSLERLDELRIEDIAEANDAAARELIARLRAGTAIAGQGPFEPGLVVGAGQSMGGGVSMIMQARHRTFEAYVGLGWSAIQSVLPQRDAEVQAAIKARSEALGRDSDPAALVTAQQIRREFDYRYPFRWEDVPEAIVAADMAGGYPVRETAPPWGSRTMPRCVAAMRSPGYVQAEAAEIDVPVLMAFGERDVSEDPRAEAAAFRNATEFTLFIAPRMAHMHNFASTRALLWDRLVRWCRSVAP